VRHRLAVDDAAALTLEDYARLLLPPISHLERTEQFLAERAAARSRRERTAHVPMHVRVGGAHSIVCLTAA
jgi:hypothetical protein